MTEPRSDPPPAPPPPPPGLTARVLRNTAGVLLLVSGFVGLFLPILQGILMMVGGLALIDLPIKGKAHRWLLRFAWYRSLANRHAAWLARWRRLRADKRARRAPRT